jgi:hypothetical protein
MAIFLGSVKSDYQIIIEDLKQKGTAFYNNDSAGWFAVANTKNNLFMITFLKGKYTFSKNDEVNKFYKNVESWAKRVSQLTRRGY